MKRKAKNECVVELPSRAEIESLCILHVVGAGRCAMDTLAERLGLSRELAPAMEQAVEPLHTSGHLEMEDGLVGLTDAGRDWLAVRLAELGS